MADSITIEHDLGRLNRTLRLYAKATAKDMDEVNAKKARDLGFKMGRMLARIRYRKAWPEMYTRSRKGRGTRIRDRKISPQAPMTSRKTKRALNWYQRLVWTETRRRQRGSGLLALSMRPISERQLRTGRDANYSRSRELGMLTTVSKDSREILIRLRTPGTEEVNRRTGFISLAIRQVNADTAAYLKTVNDKTMRQTLTSKTQKAFVRTWQLRTRIR